MSKNDEFIRKGNHERNMSELVVLTILTGFVSVLLIIALFIGVRYVWIEPNDNDIDYSYETADLDGVDVTVSDEGKPGSVGTGGLVESEVAETEDVKEDVKIESDTNQVDNIFVFKKVKLDNSNVSKGSLILVNKKHEYNFDDNSKVSRTTLYGNRTLVYQLSGSGLELNDNVFKALDNFMIAFNKATGSKDVLITSAYRSSDDQQAVYDSRASKYGDKLDLYVAKPGYSEHHTGLCVDMCLFMDGAQVYFTDHEYGTWINENASDYGFILRYKADKQDVTECAHEPWHYRYVGISHAKAIEKLGFCLEEYITYLREYTLDGNKQLLILDDGTVKTCDIHKEIPESGVIVYYVSKNDEGITEITVPDTLNDKKVAYEISGDNLGGFIVTVTIP